MDAQTPPTPLPLVTMPRVVADAEVLTERQWPVVIGLARDLRLPAIADQLGRPYGTVGKQATAAREALGVDTLQGLVAECFRRGWLR